MANVVMKAAEAISAKEGEVYMTLSGKRFHCIHMTEIEATLDIKKGEVNRLNAKMTGHKMVGMTGKYKGKQYIIESEMRKALKIWKDGGVAPVTEIEMINADASSSSGSQTVVLKDCMSDSYVLSKLDANGEFLEEDVEGTFDDWEIPEGFTLMRGLEG